MADLARTFNQMAENIQSNDNSRGQFMGNIAHELRTPMTTIKGFVDGILDGTIPPEMQNHYLQLVSEETGRLARLIQNMLDLSKLESGTQALKPEVFCLTGDIRDLPPQRPYDAMVFCLFGGTDEILDIAARQCGGTALVVRRDFRQHQFSSGVRMAGHTAADMEQELRRRGLTCTLRRFTLEFGQPFRSVEDALAFFRLYSRDGTAPARQELEARLEPSPWPDYPLYLPNPKPLCLLAIPAAQLKEGSHG